MFTLRQGLTALLRIDRMFDPNPEADRIPYLRFDPAASSTLVIAGLDFALNKNVSLIPNIEWITCDDDGDEGGFFPRLTFFVRY